MGHGLQRLTRAHGARLPVIITEGNKRPLVPVIAAKYATECNIAVRNHIPVLPHWKEYKKHPALIELFLGRLRVSTLAYFNCNNNHSVQECSYICGWLLAYVNVTNVFCNCSSQLVFFSCSLKNLQIDYVVYKNNYYHMGP